MRSELDARPFAYLVIMAGLVLAALTAVVPHYNTGYRLMFSVLLAGLLPYLVYGVLTELVRGWALILPGLLLLAFHLWLTITERYLHYDGYTDGLIYYLPVGLALFGVPLGIAVGQVLNGPERGGSRS
ncbi:MAG: hypothetical protein PVJ15_09440 [Gammaproteobacteria bacterium]|jgi:Na+(H+)/acetate symporter ActP